MTPAEVIREARNVLFERGWGRVTLKNDRGELCLEGALAVAAGCPVSYNVVAAFPASDFVREAIAERGERRALWSWNDDPGRTFDEVIEVLDRAEKIAESEVGAQQ